MSNSTALSVIVPRAALRSALGAVSKTVERRHTIPILLNAMLQMTPAGLTVTGTDLDVTITATIAEAVGDDGFAVTLPAHMLQDVEKKARASESVALDVTEGDETGRLDFEGLRVTMQSLPVDDFPISMIEAPIKADFEISTGELLAAIDGTRFAISTEETRYYLNGIFCHCVLSDGEPMLRFVATDGHRMALQTIPAPEGLTPDNMPGIIIPRKTVEILRGLCKAKGAPADMRWQVNTTKALFTIGSVTVLSKTIDGTFPDYTRVVPTDSARTVRIDRAELREAIKSVSAMSSERGRAFKLALGSFGGPGEYMATISVKNPDSGDASMRVCCDVDGESSEGFEIGFNGAYMVDILDALDGEKTIRVQLNDSGSPALISALWGSAARFVLMPMRT